MSKITLQCVKEKTKLRIKFFSFTDTEGYYIFTDQDGNNVQLYAPQTIRETNGVPAVSNARHYRSDSEDSDDNRMSRR